MNGGQLRDLRPFALFANGYRDQIARRSSCSSRHRVHRDAGRLPVFSSHGIHDTFGMSTMALGHDANLVLAVFGSSRS